MHASDWLYLLSTVTAIASIFLSNYLGKKAAADTHHRDMLLERYRVFYVPIMTRMYSFNPQILSMKGLPGNMPFMDFVEEPIPDEFQDIEGKTRQVSKNWLHEFIKTHLQYVTPEAIEIYYDHFPIKASSPTIKFNGANQISKETMKEYEARVYINNRNLIVQILKEAEKISIEVELPDIAAPLLSRYQS